MGNEGEKMKVSFKWKEGKNGVCSSPLSMNWTEFQSLKWKQQWRLKQRAWCLCEYSRDNIFSNKTCFLKAPKNDLATFWYNKFYRWLRVAPLGDGVFLKASRTSGLHSLGGWSVPHPLGCLSFLGWSSFALKHINIHIFNNGTSSIQSLYLPNPTDLTFFLH